MFTSCQRTEMQRCVGPDDMVVGEGNCDHPPPGIRPGFYHWYYGGGGGYLPGTRAEGGGLTPHSGFSSVRGGSVSRGGFGHFFSGGHGGSGHGSGE